MSSFVGRSVGKLSSPVSVDLAVAPCSRYALVVSINQPCAPVWYLLMKFHSNNAEATVCINVATESGSQKSVTFVAKFHFHLNFINLATAGLLLIRNFDLLNRCKSFRLIGRSTCGITCLSASRVVKIAIKKDRDHDRDLKNFSWSWSRSQPSLPAIISAIKNFWDIRTTTIVHLLFNTCQLHCNSGGSLWKWRCNLNLKCLQIC